MYSTVQYSTWVASSRFGMVSKVLSKPPSLVSTINLKKEQLVTNINNCTQKQQQKQQQKQLQQQKQQQNNNKNDNKNKNKGVAWG